MNLMQHKDIASIYIEMMSKIASEVVKAQASLHCTHMREVWDQLAQVKQSLYIHAQSSSGEISLAFIFVHTLCVREV